MAITLAAIVFDEARTSAREKYEEVGGRDSRSVVVSGLIAGCSSLSDLEARLDAILEAASDEDFSAFLSLRTGRRLAVRRAAFQREVNRDKRMGSFVLELESQHPFEESDNITDEPWTITESGAEIAIETAGNAPAVPAILLVATGTIVKPAFGDGTRTLRYDGTVAIGQTLAIDGERGQVLLDDEDVTPYTEGLFPQIDPEGTTLTYTDDSESSHSADATVSFRDRWW